MPRSAGLLLTLVFAALAIAGWLEVFRLKAGMRSAEAPPSAPGDGWTALTSGLTDDQTEIFHLQEQNDLLIKENERLSGMLLQRKRLAGQTPSGESSASGTQALGTTGDQPVSPAP